MIGLFLHVLKTSPNFVYRNLLLPFDLESDSFGVPVESHSAEAAVSRVKTSESYRPSTKLHKNTVFLEPSLQESHEISD